MSKKSETVSNKERVAVALHGKVCDPVQVGARMKRERLDMPTLLALASANGSVRLSGEAAFCAAVMAGVPTVVSGGDATKITLTTAYPVDVWIDAGKIKVFSAPND